MRTPLRIVLPAMMGILSLPLMLWDIHNGDQASDILLRFLNGPAYSIAMPIAKFLKLAAPKHHLLVFPAILIWWWFLGFTFDRGSAWKKAHWRWPLIGMLAVLIALFLWTAIAADALRLWSQAGAFRPPSTLLILRFLCTATWFITLPSAGVV